VDWRKVLTVTAKKARLKKQRGKTVPTPTLRVGHIAVHEAAHAVAAAYLKVPFRCVTLRSFSKTDAGHVRAEGLHGISRFVSDRRGGYRPRSKKELKDIANRMLTDRAVMVFTARAAVESAPLLSANGRPLSTSEIQGSYQQDEKQIKDIAHCLRASDFEAWRKQMLKRARDIVSIPHVWRSILSVALRLEQEMRTYEMKVGNGRVSATEVRDTLRRATEHNVA